MSPRDVPVPSIMARLPRDARGYPVPVMVYRDEHGRPHFQINNHVERARLIAQDRCAICGETLLRGRWFIGGPACAFHERGAYIDPPTHGECARYALQVCPYLAAPTYTGRIDAATLPKDHAGMIFADDTQDPDRPPLFVAVMSIGTRIINHGEFVAPVRPYRRVEYWRHGERLTGEAWVEVAREHGQLVGTRISEKFGGKAPPARLLTTGRARGEGRNPKA